MKYPGRKNENIRKSVKIDPLEPRQLLSAAVVSQIPAQNLTDTQTPVALTLGTYFDDSEVPAGDTVVNLQPDMAAPYNNIPIVLTNSATPQTVANFLQYISSGEYANVIIHRSIPGFVIQGGGYDTDGTHITTFGTIPGESATATLKNTTGTIAMALSTGPDSGTSEWFINLGNNPQLDDTSDGGPFTAFGSVIDNGMTTVNQIASLPAIDDTDNGAWTNLPIQNYSVQNGGRYSGAPADAFVSLNPVVVTNILTYSVTSDTPSIATGAISNGQLTISPVSGGMAHFTVTATDLGGGTASSTFAVTISSSTPPSASQLAFAQVPVNTLAGATMAPISVNVEGGNGNVFTSDNSNITLAIASGPAGAVLGGTTTIAVTNGVATFSDLVLSTPGAYTLTATDGSLTSATSSSFNIVVPSTTTLTASAHTFVVGQTNAMNIHVSSANNGNPVPTGTVSVYEDGNLHGTYNLDTNGNAAVSLSVSTANPSTVYDAVYNGDSTYEMSTSSNVIQDYLPASSAQLSLTKVAVPTAAIAGGSFKGQVTAMITNPGATTMSGNFSVVLFADPASTGLDTSPMQLGIVTKKLTLKTGKTGSIPFKIKSLPPTLANGTYHLVAELTDPQSQSALVTTTQTTTVSASEVDLSGTFSTNPVTVKAGKKSKVMIVVTNSSSANMSASGKLPIVLYAATASDGSDEISAGSITKSINLKPGGSVKISVPATVADGEDFLIATLDAGAVVFGDDVNLANNTFDVPLSVMG